MQTISTNMPKYPVKVTTDKGRVIQIPQQKKFGDYCKKHGCSVTAVSIALQYLGINQSDKSLWNPKEVKDYAKKHLSGYNGSKLTIWGCKSAINKIAGKERAFWHSNNGKKNKKIRTDIDTALKKGYVVLFEESGPVHTVAFLGITKDGKWITATNGKVVHRNPSSEIKKALHGMTGAKNQKHWYKGKDHGAGYVIVKG